MEVKFPTLKRKILYLAKTKVKFKNKEDKFALLKNLKNLQDFFSNQRKLGGRSGKSVAFLLLLVSSSHQQCL